MICLIYIKYDPSYKTQLLQFMKNIPSYIDDCKGRELFEWKFERNPHSKETCIYLAVDGNEIVGALPTLPQTYTLKDKLIAVINVIDVLVRPDYRGRGVFKGFSAALNNDLNSIAGKVIMLGLTVNKFTYLGGKRLGWVDTGTVNAFWYRISLINCLKKIFLQSKNTDRSRFKIDIGNSVIELTDTLMVNDIALLIKNHQDKDKLVKVRDEAYFNWKYSYHPENLSYIYCWKGSDLVAYIILKHNSCYKTTIEEYFSVSDYLLNNIIDITAKTACLPIIRSLVFSDRVKNTMRRCGFINKPVYVYLLRKQSIPGIMNTTPLPPKDDDFFIEKIDIRNFNNWIMHSADIF